MSVIMKQKKLPEVNFSKNIGLVTYIIIIITVANRYKGMQESMTALVRQIRVSAVTRLR